MPHVKRSETHPPAGIGSGARPCPSRSVSPHVWCPVTRRRTLRSWHSSLRGSSIEPKGYLSRTRRGSLCSAAMPTNASKRSSGRCSATLSNLLKESELVVAVRMVEPRPILLQDVLPFVAVSVVIGRMAKAASRGMASSYWSCQRTRTSSAPCEPLSHSRGRALSS